MNIYKVLPDLSNERQMRLWQQSIQAVVGGRSRLECSEKNHGREDPRPIGKGSHASPDWEQSALYSVSGLIPILGHQSEVPAQFYLTTWAVDEARHTELFALLWAHRPGAPLNQKISLRLFISEPDHFQDPCEWLTGVLASKSMAQVVSHELRDLDLDPVLSDICAGILEDEARHLGFNHIYMEDQFRQFYAKDPEKADEKADGLRDRMKYVLEGVPPIIEAVREDMDELGIDMDKVQDILDRVARHRLDKAINGGKDQALGTKTAETEPEAETALQ